MISRAQILLLVAGLILGPGYIAYAKLLSGSTLTEETLLATGDSGQPRAMTVRLAPEMGTVAVYVAATHRGRAADSTAGAAVYMAEIERAGEPVWEGGLRFEAPAGEGAERVRRRLTTLSSPAAGDYRLRIRRLEDDGPPLERFRAGVRRNLMIASPKLYSGGLILFFGAMVWLLVGTRPPP